MNPVIQSLPKAIENSPIRKLEEKKNLRASTKPSENDQSGSKKASASRSKSKPKNSPAKNKSHEQVDDETNITQRKKVQIKPNQRITRKLAQQLEQDQLIQSESTQHEEDVPFDDLYKEDRKSQRKRKIEGEYVNPMLKNSKKSI